MPALDLMVKLFSESKEEIHRYITKIEVTADTTYKGVVDDIKTKNGKYFSLAQTSVLRRSEDKLSFANTKSKIVLNVYYLSKKTLLQTFHCYLHEWTITILN